MNTAPPSTQPSESASHQDNSQAAELEAWLQQFQPEAPSEELKARLSTALELPAQEPLSSREQEQLERWLPSFQPAKTSQRLNAQLAQHLRQLRRPSAPMLRFFKQPLGRSLGAAAALGLLAWLGMEFFNKPEASSPIAAKTNVETQEPSTQKSQAAESALAATDQESKLAKLPLFPQSNSATRKPFEFLPQDSPYQRVNSSGQEQLSFPEAFYSGPPSKRNWQPLELLEPQLNTPLIAPSDPSDSAQQKPVETVEEQN